jgi:hypothetical protein
MTKESHGSIENKETVQTNCMPINDCVPALYNRLRLLCFEYNYDGYPVLEEKA